MHEQDGDTHTFFCDACGDSEDLDGEFGDVWSELKDAGWRAFKNDDDEWEHRCPVCRPVWRGRSR